jgi:hypothetical protein
MNVGRMLASMSSASLRAAELAAASVGTACMPPRSLPAKQGVVCPGLGKYRSPMIYNIKEIQIKIYSGVPRYLGEDGHFRV